MLSEKRRTILEFIKDYIGKKGYSPSIREIANRCKISSPSMVQYHLKILERDGYIHRDPSVPRSIRPSKSEDGHTSVPLLGVIAAGEPIDVPSPDSWNTVALEWIGIPTKMARGLCDIYALQVKGTSMVDALVDDGDIIILQKSEAADEGEMVAIWLVDRSETTLKRVYHDPNGIRLQPANRQMKPLYVDPSNVKIQGRVIGVIRNPEAADSQVKGTFANGHRT
jgi:repressor LexA